MQKMHAGANQLGPRFLVGAQSLLAAVHTLCMLQVVGFASQGCCVGFRKTWDGSLVHGLHQGCWDAERLRRRAQVMVIPISEASAGYAQEVRRVLRDAHFFVDTDLADSKMQKKVREAQLAQYNYILVREPAFPPPSSQATLAHA